MSLNSDNEEGLKRDMEKLANHREEFIKTLEDGGGIGIKPEKTMPERPTIRLEFVKTKAGYKAGPYFYAYWRKDGKLHKKYIGKHLPTELQSIYRGQAESQGRDAQDIADAMRTMF